LESHRQTHAVEIGCGQHPAVDGSRSPGVISKRLINLNFLSKSQSGPCDFDDRDRFAIKMVGLQGDIG
jgi:hypothetical protein